MSSGLEEYGHSPGLGERSWTFDPMTCWLMKLMTTEVKMTVSHVATDFFSGAPSLKAGFLLFEYIVFIFLQFPPQDIIQGALGPPSSTGFLH